MEPPILIEGNDFTPWFRHRYPRRSTATIEASAIIPDSNRFRIGSTLNESFKLPFGLRIRPSPHLLWPILGGLARGHRPGIDRTFANCQCFTSCAVTAIGVRLRASYAHGIGIAFLTRRVPDHSDVLVSLGRIRSCIRSQSVGERVPGTSFARGGSGMNYGTGSRCTFFADFTGLRRAERHDDVDQYSDDPTYGASS